MAYPADLEPNTPVLCVIVGCLNWARLLRCVFDVAVVSGVGGGVFLKLVVVCCGWLDEWLCVVDVVYGLHMHMRQLADMCVELPLAGGWLADGQCVDGDWDCARRIIHY